MKIKKNFSVENWIRKKLIDFILSIFMFRFKEIEIEYIGKYFKISLRFFTLKIKI